MIPALGRLGSPEFKASLSYRANSRPAELDSKGGLQRWLGGETHLALLQRMEAPLRAPMWFTAIYISSSRESDII